ncbi:MAG: FIST C-terminal domain-containing protein [Leptospiraceae bacterium]|nr:FIST C-terminal domain-containing protein [Leptospiraceae bacterium]
MYKNQYISSQLFHNSDEIPLAVQDKNAGLILCFYGADFDYTTLFHTLKKTGIPFLGCMDIARLSNSEYRFETNSVAVMTISKEILEKVGVIAYDMRRTTSNHSMYQSSKDEYSRILTKLGFDLSSPDMERDFSINLLFGLQSANSVLSAQNEVSLFQQTVGGSSGGKLDFISSSVISSKGMGSIGATAVIRLKPEYYFFIDRASSFDPMEGILAVTKLASPRYILELNNRPAAEEYARVIGKSTSDLGAAVYAMYTLGIEPGDGEKLITSIMKDDGKTGLLTYNDLLEGAHLNIYKAKLQYEDRLAKLQTIDKEKLIGYISFDCVLCYLARDANKEIETIAALYETAFPGTPKIGFGTFSENFCGANVNQTETYLAILKR